MSGNTIRTGRGMGMLAAIACGAGVASAQPHGGGQPGVPSPLPPMFLPAVVFHLDVGEATAVQHPYGLASTDFLDASGAPGQDGYPEIAVAGAGLDILDFVGAGTSCDSEPDLYGSNNHNVVAIYRNKGATVRWDGTDGPDPDSDPDDPLDALELVQILPISAVSPHMWAMEMVFADVTGENGPDLVLVGSDPDGGSGWRGFLLVYKNLGTGLFDPVPYEIKLTDVELRGIVAADLDLDGDIDLAASANDLRGSLGYCPPGDQNVVVVFESTLAGGVFGFENPPQTVPLDTPIGSPSGDITIADFVSLMPGQPLLDLVTPDPANNSVSAITNLGLMIFDANNAYPPAGCEPGYYFASAIGGRFGADLHSDIAGVHNNDSIDTAYVEILHGDGSGAFEGICADPPGYRIAPFLDAGEYPFAHGIDSGDFNGDAYPDLAIAAFYLQSFEPPLGIDLVGLVAAISGKSDGTFLTRPDGSCFPFETLQQQTVNVMAVDLDANGFDDVVAANHYPDELGNYTISVLINRIQVTPAGAP